jgi:hypothetical protein
MRQFRLSTLMLLILFMAVGVAVVVHKQRAAQQEAELQAQLAPPLPVVLPPRQQKTRMMMRTEDENDLIKRLNEQPSGK